MNMRFQPCNRYILIERITQPKDEIASLIELPEGFKPPTSTHELVKIKCVSCGTKPPLAQGDKAVVLSHMIEEVDFGEGKVYLVLENHVVGIIKEELQ
tara:strand:- start:1532 stop:1825 length:294 start_codon:yes stop_codon:yes gene_type:complete